MSDTLKERLISIAVLSIATLLVLYVGLRMYGSWKDGRDYPPISAGSCNIAVVPLQGTIVPYANYWGDQESGKIETIGDWTTSYIRAAEADPNIVGLLMRVDSYGGAIGPAEEIMRALKTSPLPSVALIREGGASAAYLAATGADTIIASPFSEVGSIGVTYSYVEQALKNEREGVRFVQLSSGPYKDAGDPNKELTEAEVAVFRRNIDAFFNLFVDTVAANRNLPREQVLRAADGSTYPGKQAMELGLVDSLGDTQSAREWFAQALEVSPEDIWLCE